MQNHLCVQPVHAVGVSSNLVHKLCSHSWSWVHVKVQEPGLRKPTLRFRPVRHSQEQDARPARALDALFNGLRNAISSAFNSDWQSGVTLGDEFKTRCIRLKGCAIFFRFVFRQHGASLVCELDSVFCQRGRVHYATQICSLHFAQTSGNISLERFLVTEEVELCCTDASPYSFLSVFLSPIVGGLAPQNLSRITSMPSATFMTVYVFYRSHYLFA